MGEISIDPKFNIHETYKKVRILNPYRNLGAAPTGYEVETSDYMYEINIPNDGAATIYTGVSGSQLWGFVNDLVVGLKSTGLMTKLFYYYLFLGATSVSQKYNLKDTTSYQINWFGDWIFDNKGALGNGSNTYGDTGFIPSMHKNVDSNGITVVIGTNNVPIKSEAIEIGSYNNANQASLIVVKQSSSLQKFETRMNGNLYSIPNTDSRGIYTSVKNASNITKIFKAGALLQTYNSGGTLPTRTTFIGNMNFNGSPYSPGYSNQRYQGALDHSGLIDIEVGNLHTLIDTFENAIGRKTW